jgi:hypothetical protein
MPGVKVKPNPDEICMPDVVVESAPLLQTCVPAELNMAQIKSFDAAPTVFM